jgi:hypothetical protein
MYAITGAAAGCYVPDIGDTFTVTKVWEWRRWQLTPFPWHRRHVHVEEHSYRVSAWMRRRQPRPEPQDEQSRMVREIIAEMMADGRIEGPRGLGPDRVPLEFCHREEAEYVEGVGVAGTIVRVSDVAVTGRVSWDEETIQYYRDFADDLAGEPLT